MLTILLQILPQILSLAIEERREQFVAITANYNVVGKQHFQNYHYVKDHYKGKRKGRCFAFKPSSLHFENVFTVNRSLT